MANLGGRQMTDESDLKQMFTVFELADVFRLISIPDREMVGIRFRNSASANQTRLKYLLNGPDRGVPLLVQGRVSETQILWWWRRVEGVKFNLEFYIIAGPGSVTSAAKI